MPVVSNTSPLLNLAIIGELRLLREQFGDILIPPAVLDELQLDTDLPGTQTLREARSVGWIQVEAVSNEPFVRTLEHELDRGESEAIVLAIETGATHLLLDEREGRRVARSLGLNATGILGILLRARRQGHLPSLREALRLLREEAGFWIAPELEADILRESGEA